MLGLPKSTELKKQLPKTAIYAKFAMNNAGKEKFDADISKLMIVNEISRSTSAIPAGDTITSFYVVLVSLKRKKYSEETIAQISRLISQKMLLVLEYGNKAQLAVYHTKLITTDWKPIETLNVVLKGLNLDAVWENAIKELEGGEWDDALTLDENILKHEQIALLKRQIAALEKKARAEKQPKKAFEMVQQINDLKQTLKKLGGASQSAKEKPIVAVPNVTKKHETQTSSAADTAVEPAQTVKALSIMPEYAAAIFDGFKTIEWRSWKTNYRGDLLICASSKKLRGCIAGYALCMVHLDDVVPFTRKHLNGAMIDYMFRPAGYAWKLSNVRQIVPFPYKGKLHIYDVDASLVKVLTARNVPEAKADFDKYYKPLYIAAGGEF